MADMKFTVIDTKTGKYPDLEQIALHEDWAKGLIWCDMEGFMVSEDGTLILADECGKFSYCPDGRFEVIPDSQCTETAPKEPTKETESTLKDSGSRREFDTGAVRDIAEGKGRCDLMPLDVIANILGDDNAPDIVLDSICAYMETGNTKALFQAVEYFRNAWGVPTETMFLELAKHFEEGAKKYGEYNWQKGIPVHCYIDSAVRHYLKWLRGDKDEPHDRAFVWNLICCIWTIENKPELFDLPRNPQKGGE